MLRAILGSLHGLVKTRALANLGCQSTIHPWKAANRVVHPLALDCAKRAFLSWAQMLRNGLDATDETTVNERTRLLEQDEYRLKQLVIDIVKHPAFRQP